MRSSIVVSEGVTKIGEPGIFSLMNPMSSAIEAAHRLSEHYEVYILSTTPRNNLSAWSYKDKWFSITLATSSRNVLS